MMSHVPYSILTTHTEKSIITSYDKNTKELEKEIRLGPNKTITNAKINCPSVTCSISNYRLER